MVNQIILIIIASVFSAGTTGNIIMYLIKKHDRIEELEKTVSRIAEGLQLGLENDIVIFNALRHNHINGESEAQEKKMNDYFYNCTSKGMNV